MVKTAVDAYCSCGLWDVKEAMVIACPEMIPYLAMFRDLLNRILPEIDVTDPVSG